MQNALEIAWKVIPLAQSQAFYTNSEIELDTLPADWYCYKLGQQTLVVSPTVLQVSLEEIYNLITDSEKREEIYLKDVLDDLAIATD